MIKQKKAITLNPKEPVIFLDTNSTDSKDNKKNSYLFVNPIKTITAFNQSELIYALNEITKLSQNTKYWITGYIRYEAGYYFLPKMFNINKKSKTKKPLLWFGVYKSPIKFSQKEINPKIFTYNPSCYINKKLNFKTYQQKIKNIKTEIKKGNTYQVNFTFDNIVLANTSDENLYFSLRKQQKTKYSAFIKNEFDTILSFSPELFFQISDDKITVKPMKGTIKRGKTRTEDELFKKNILSDEKIKAENLMIVDLLRNDLGKIAKNGTVKVEKLLQLETHSTLHQIISTISANIDTKNLNFLEIFEALFPCGSVTGAPKIETMKIIKKLEDFKRGIYCGAIGFISPNKTKKSVFSVPIRILQKTNEKKSEWIYKVGGGIVWDSNAKTEWKETDIKTLFLKKNIQKNFNLIETMLCLNNKILFLQEHLNRLEKSANFFGFAIKTADIEKELKSIPKTTKNLVLRLKLKKNGHFCIEKIKVSKQDYERMNNPLKKTKLSTLILDKKNIFLQHKTDYRPWYKNTKMLIDNGTIWDEIFTNQDGEICEGSRNNIFVKLNGKLYTPPISAGLLNGILRQNLLNKGECFEKKLYVDDLKKAEAIYLGNSVRGLVEVKLDKANQIEGIKSK